MYRVVLYYLLFLFVVAAGLSFFGILSYGGVSLILSALFILAICLVFNYIFAWAFDAQVNLESAYITALILFFLITPLKSLTDTTFISMAFWGSVWAMISKYIYAINKKHVFNPAALAVVMTGVTLHQTASWWVGTASMFPFVLIGGLLVVRKLLRFDFIISFLVVTVLFSVVPHYAGIDSLAKMLKNLLVVGPAFFLAFVMLTEPLTTPPKRWLRVFYGGLVGLLTVPGVHIGVFYFSPELALLVGNIFSYIVSPKEKLILSLLEKKLVANDTYDFVFKPSEPLKFEPGQYLEWTLGSSGADSRGNRRYFTISSSPTESEIRMGIKFYPDASTFKSNLLQMKSGDTLIASQLAGEFVMPKDVNKKLVFIAGGIGVTPFRSMIKYLVDKNEKRTVTMLYSNKTKGDVAYHEIFDEAEKKLGIKTVYALTDVEAIPADWKGCCGFVTADIIKKEVPDYKDRIFYLSGPHGMVVAFEKTIADLGVSKRNIKKDFFPGFA